MAPLFAAEGCSSPQKLENTRPLGDGFSSVLKDPYEEWKVEVQPLLATTTAPPLVPAPSPIPAPARP